MDLTIQLLKFNKTTVQIEELRETHKELLNNGDNNNDKVDEIIDILGGIGKINEYHSVSNTHCSFPTYCMSKHDVFLLLLLSESLGTKIRKILVNKSCIVLVSLLLILDFILMIIPFDFIIERCILLSLLIIYFVFVMLLINKQAFQLIIKTFECWLIFIYGLRVVICHALYFGPNNDKGWSFIIIQSVLWIVAIINACFLDAITMRLMYKSLFGFLGAMFFIITFILCTFTYKKGYYNFEIFGTDLSIPITSWLGSSSQIVAIFIMKQTLTPIVQKTTAFIKIKCKIKWIDYQQQPDHQVINSLGGIDEVLKRYLSNNDCGLYNDQIMQINHIFRLKLQQKNRKKSSLGSSYVECQYNASNVNQVEYFLKHHTFLHLLFSLKIAEQIIHFIYNKITVVIICVFLIYSNINVILFYYSENTLQCVIGLFLVIIYVIYFLFLMSSMNTKGFKLIAQSFEFWFKFIIGIKWAICRWIYINTDYKIHKAQVLIEHIAWMIAIIDYSFADAILVKQSIKITFGIMCGIYFNIVAIQDTINAFHSSPENYYQFHLFGNNISVNLANEVASCSRVLSLFIWKQLISWIVQTDESSLIKLKCKIVWTN